MLKLLDISRLLTRLSEGLLPTGVDRVGLAYVERYRRNARAVLSESGFSRVLPERVSQEAFDLLLSSRPSRSAIRGLILRGILSLSQESLDDAVLLHTSHNGMEHLRYYQAMRRRGARSVFMVHDLIPLTHSEYCRPGVDDVHRRRIHTALRHADGLILNSHETRNTLDTEAQRAGLITPPNVVAHLAPGIVSRERPAAPLNHPYFVMLGTIEPRKNHWFMLHVWRKLVEIMGKQAPKLVIIGRRGWECENVVDMLERCESIRQAVVEQSDCTDEHLRAWLLHARALIFPSFVEGYGMPLVEALAQSVPVLASDLCVFREIAGDIPDYLDPLDGPAWTARVQAYMDPSHSARTTQIMRLARFQVPTWEAHFQQVDNFLETLPAPSK
ncbi:glycosyltransferase family 4 protein [Burkholderia pseudomultivorans]|uniref:glycosyltransferase family 4 protein n=1 Tax=Burkholderia pseudomultivorans TaxID=1207504 RepID=UPI0009BD2A7B|nr:glycosyltransferase family 1 protein [Burkholderia pseudomultivorans]